MSPKVSIIVPNYNHSAYLKKRIDSILAQTFSDYELILLDDCSTDCSREILNSYKDNPHVSHLIINERNTGSPFKQWVKGIELARGKYIWIAESDDYASADFLKETASLLDLHPEANVCLTGSWVVDQNDEPVDDKYKHVDQWPVDGKIYRFSSSQYIIDYMSRSNTIYNGSMVLFRKEGCLENMNFEFINMRYAGDWLFWIEQIKKGKYVIELHRKLNYWRKHTCNTTLEGLDNFNSLPEVAYIMNYLLNTTLKSHWVDSQIIKGRMYRVVKKHSNLTDERRQELFSYLERKYHIMPYHEHVGRWCLSYKKHVRSLFRQR